MDTLVFAIKYDELKRLMASGYASRYADERIEIFSNALREGTDAIRIFENASSHGEDTDAVNRIRIYICECLLQIEWVSDNIGDIKTRDVCSTIIMEEFQKIREPDAMAHFTVAHSFMLALDSVVGVSNAEWLRAYKHYCMALESYDKLENDPIGVYRFTCYNLGLFHKNGWGVEKDKVKARYYLTKALEAGFDCQDTIDSL